MAISMKDLHSSSDEEIQNDDDLKSVKLETWNISLSSTLEPGLPTPDAPKQSWIKGQVSESFKRLSRISPVSLDITSINDFDEDGLSKPKMSKAGSETDVKISSEPVEVRDSISKKQWIKGHINNYLTKSKRLYLSRNEAATTSDKKAPNSPNMSLRDSNMRDSSENIENNDTYDRSLTIMTDDLVAHSPTLEHKPLHLMSPGRPVTPLSPTLDNDSFQIVEKSDCINPEDVDGKIDSVPSKLTFSELLNSDSSQSMNKGERVPTPIPTFPEIDDTFEHLSVLSSEEEEINNLTDQIIKEDLQFHLRPGEGTSVTYQNIWICSCFTCFYFLWTLPPYLYGLISGSVITYLIVCIVIWLLCPNAQIYDDYQSNLKSFLKRSMRPESVKGLPKLDALSKPKDLKGWISMATTFNDVYDKDLAKEVYSLVHNESLYIFLCKINESETMKHVQKQKNLQKKKRLLKGKKKVNRLLTEQQVPIFSFEWAWQIDLEGCSLSLKPDDLSIRRIWNKKYPIEISIPKGKMKKKGVNLTLEDLTLTIEDMIDGFNDEPFMLNNILNDKEETFYLFGNTGREKEDWFYRLQLCIKPLKHQVTLKDFNDNKLSKQPSDSYPHYMAELIKESQKVLQRTANGKKMEPYLAWLNIFIGRAFWDFWHESVWEQRLKQKIQSRLSKLNTPPFITDIKLKDLNCGHNIPIIHKGSMPVLDENGIWSDLQVSYKGYFTLTLETQLNIDYYVDLVSSIVKQKADPKENVQLSKIKSSGLSIQCDDNLDDNSSEKESDIESAGIPDEEYGFHDEIQDVYSDAFENTDIPGLEAEIDPVLSDPRTKAFLQSRTGKKVVSLVGWLAKSRIAKRVAETDFAKKAYERAYKKFQKMPIVLKVEIQSVKGNVAVNIPPPPTNRLWYGFRGNPVIFITASPKVGDKQVRLTYLTNWIERKLKEEFKKFLVLPNMQDLSIKLMDPHIHDLTPDRPDL